MDEIKAEKAMTYISKWKNQGLYPNDINRAELLARSINVKYLDIYQEY